MINLFQNAELIRNVRSQLRPRKVAAVAAICAVLSISVGYYFALRPANAGDKAGAMELLEFVVGAQALILTAGGSIACLNSIYKEKEQNSFDFQRVTRLTPLELTIGKLFGPPILMYFVCLCLMPLAIFASAVARPRFSFLLMAYVVLLAASIAFHTVSLMMSVLSIRGSQTGAIILLLLLLWISVYSGNMLSSGLFRLSSLGPFFAPQLVSETTWDPVQIETTFKSDSYEYTLNHGMTDVVFGYHVHHAPILLLVDSLLALWFFLAVVRNIKRDPAEYELYSPAQSLGFAFFMNLIFLAFFNWHYRDNSAGPGFLLFLNMAVFALLGIALIRNRERTRRVLRSSTGYPAWMAIAWPAPLLFAGTISVGALIAIGAAYSGTAGKSSELSFFTFRCLFFALWLIRDLQFLQWMGLRRGRHPLVMGVLYLTIVYISAAILLTALTGSEPAWNAYSAFLFPTPVFNLDLVSWAIHPAVWSSAILAQFAAIAFLFYLQRRKLSELGEAPPAAESRVVA